MYVVQGARLVKEENDVREKIEKGRIKENHKVQKQAFCVKGGEHC